MQLHTHTHIHTHTCTQTHIHIHTHTHIHTLSFTIHSFIHSETISMSCGLPNDIAYAANMALPQLPQKNRDVYSVLLWGLITSPKWVSVSIYPYRCT